ncbi:MAG TPA: HDIG domain-containing protein [Kamptonema sp.]|nr:HDIG domain-containing protein [Kamptonema sp.]
MNTLQSLAANLIEQLNAVRRVSQHSTNTQSNRGLAKAVESRKHLLSALPHSSALREIVTPSGSPTSKSSLKGRARSPLMLVVAVVSLTGTMGHRFYNQPKLDIGTKAPQTILSPATVSIPDRRTTEEQRKKARTGSVPVLAIDPTADRRTYQELQEFLSQGNQLREVAGPFPFVGTETLSIAVQTYLRECQEWEWRVILAQADESTETTVQSGSEKFTEPKPTLNKFQQQAVVELQTYLWASSQEDFNRLTENISQARKRYVNALDALSRQSVSELGQVYDSSLFELSDAVWLQTQTGINRTAKLMLAQGIPPGLPRDILKEAVRLQVKETVPAVGQSLAINSLGVILKPNLVENVELTLQLAELAAQKVKPVMASVEQGGVIVKAGQEITPADFVLLDYFGLSRREVNWVGLTGFICLVSGAIGIVLLVERYYRLRRRDHLLLLLLTLSTPVLLTVGVPLTSLPAIGILAGSFYGSAVGVVVVGLLSAVLPIGLEIDAIHLLASAAGGLLGALMAGRLRSREELALLGVAVGFTQGIVYLFITLITSATAGSIWYALIGTVALQGLGGLAWSIVALGLSPYLEHLFDLITPIRLAELANPNRPLLKRLAAEAPGTFQHTVFVASLAEAAARSLGCNVELVRTGTLYHDIGKMHDPMGFCENQMNGTNKHDEINDPWVSAEIIKKHVSEGLVMARKYRLPKAIQAFIPEHQGTMLIAYFYHQAQQIVAEDERMGKGKELITPKSCTVQLNAPKSALTKSDRPICILREEDFRYDGPIPQSRETGIVMLADSCEAALRSLKDATHEEALSMVNKIMRARWQDNQLVDSGLTREDLSQVAEIFVRVWEQFNHKRIAYPKAVLTPR